MIHKTLDILAKIISALLYPLWMPTYGMILLYLTYGRLHITMHAAYWWITIGGTFVITALIPLSLILIAIRRGTVSDIYITKNEERTTPYIYTSTCYAFWTYFLAKIINAPLYLTLVGTGALIALVIVANINRKWKISAHLTGWGGLIGGILSYYLFYGIMPSIGCIALLLSIALILMYARLWLNAHTDWQVVAGFGLGLLSATLPTLIVTLAHV